MLFIQVLILLLFFRPKDIDPCTNVTCDYHAICKAFSAFDARCVCDDNCPSYEEPVCSSNSTTFKNKCFCLLDICRRKSNHTLYHPGSCTGKRADYKDSLNHLNQRMRRYSVMRYMVPLMTYNITQFGGHLGRHLRISVLSTSHFPCLGPK